jgi:AcrR family transcriptional regulator
VEPLDRDIEAHSAGQTAEPPTESDPKELRDSEYRRRILAAASRLLEQNGIDAVNMYQIAQEAGIGQGTLYRRYEHSGEIYSDLFRTSLEQFVDDLEQFCGRTSSLTAFEQLYQVIARLVDYIDDKAELLSAISCMYAGKKSLLLHKRPIILRLHSILADLFTRGCSEGEAARIDVTLTVHFLLSALAPEQYFHHRDSLGYSKERYTASLRRLFIDGLQKR